MAKASTACPSGVYLDHKHRIETLEKKTDTATAGRSNLHKRIDIDVSKVNNRVDDNVARMDMWKYLFLGGSAVFVSISGVTTAVVLGFWYLIGNEVILKALVAVKDAG